MIRNIFKRTTDGSLSNRSRQNTISFLLSILETVVAVALTAIVSRLLPSESFGSFSVILSAVFIFGVLSQLGVAPIVLRETSALKGKEGSNPFHLWYHADLMVLPTTLIALTGLIIFFWYADLNQVTAITVLAVITQLFCLVGLALRSAALQGYGVSNFTHIVMFTIPGFTTGSSMLLLWWLGYGVDLNTALWANACGLMIASLLLQWRRNRLTEKPDTPIKKDRSLIAYLRKQSIPVAGTSAVGVLNSNIDILMLGTLAGPLYAGHYMAVMKIAAFLAIVRVRLAILTSYLIPSLFEKRDFAAIQRTCRTVAAVSVGVSIIFLAVSLVWGAQILTALYGREFAVAAPVLSMIILAFTVSSAAGMVGGVFIMTGHQSINFKASCLSAVVNVVLNPIAIYYFGALGAAATLLASITAYFIVMTIIMRRKFGIDVSILGYLREPVDPELEFKDVA